MTTVEMARKVRAHVVSMSHKAETAHLASSLSVVDILAVAADVLAADPTQPQDPHRPRLILSKGHAVSALYGILAERGYFDPKWLERFNEDGFCLPEQPSPGCVPGMELATGSLGHGLPVGVGMALASRIRDLNFRVVVVMSDGECQEGSIWEAAMLAGFQKLHNLMVVIDHNKWQATCRTCEAVGLEPLGPKWEAFGWNVVEIDGHDHQQLRAALSQPHPQLPTAIVAHTVKGKGVSFMQDDNNWHYRVPNASELQSALEEIKNS